MGLDLMNMSSSLEFVVSSELEKFILNHQFLKPGDKLEGKIIQVKENGKVLINFGKFRAVAEINFPIKEGDTLPVAVDSKGPKLKLRVDNPQLEVSRRTRDIVSKIDIFPEKAFSKVQVEVQKVLDSESAQAGRDGRVGRVLPEIIKQAFTRISTYFEALDPAAASTLKLVTQLSTNIRKSGIFFEKDLGTAISKLLKEAGRNIGTKELPRLPQIKEIIANDLKPNLLVLKDFLDRPEVLQKAASPLQMDTMRRITVEILNNIDNQLNSAVEKQTARPPQQENLQVFHFTLPLKESGKNAKLKVYYSKKDKGKDKDKKKFRLSLLLEMERLGDIRSDFLLMGKSLNITFFVKNHVISEKIESNFPEITENLEDTFDYLVLKVFVSERKIADFDTEDLDMSIVTTRMVDVKV
ncbi:MAG: hypothetical protein GY950_02345 [bacterium]|nr:hypothetical protein [bacterium]